MWKKKVIPVTIGTTGTISKTFRNRPEQYSGKERSRGTTKKKKTVMFDTAHVLRKVLMLKYEIFNVGNKITCSTNCKYRRAATLYTLQMWFVSLCKCKKVMMMMMMMMMMIWNRGLPADREVAANMPHVKVKVKFSRYTPGMTQRVGRGIALLFHDRCTRRGWVDSSTPRPHFTPGKDPVPILQEAVWAPGAVWTGGKSWPHRDSIPKLPARSQSLYRLSYPDHICHI